MYVYMFVYIYTAFEMELNNKTRLSINWEKVMA